MNIHVPSDSEAFLKHEQSHLVQITCLKIDEHCIFFEKFIRPLRRRRRRRRCTPAIILRYHKSRTLSQNLISLKRDVLCDKMLSE